MAKKIISLFISGKPFKNQFQWFSVIIFFLRKLRKRYVLLIVTWCIVFFLIFTWLMAKIWVWLKTWQGGKVGKPQRRRSSDFQIYSELNSGTLMQLWLRKEVIYWWKKAGVNFSRAKLLVGKKINHFSLTNFYASQASQKYLFIPLHFKNKKLINGQVNWFIKINFNVGLFFFFTTTFSVTDQFWLTSCRVTDWFWLISFNDNCSFFFITARWIVDLHNTQWWQGNVNKWFQKWYNKSTQPDYGIINLTIFF